MWQQGSVTATAEHDLGTRIRNKIRGLRFKHGEMTQQSLAEKVGVTRQTINAIELGKYSPTLEVAFRVARTFNTPLEQIFAHGDTLAGP